MAVRPDHSAAESIFLEAILNNMVAAGYSEAMASVSVRQFAGREVSWNERGSSHLPCAVLRAAAALSKPTV